jgi:hypothetical protein
MPWNVDNLQKQFKTLERRKHGDAQRCRVEVRAGKEDYKRFYDEETASEMMAFILGTDAALEGQERLLHRLEELRNSIRSGSADAPGVYSVKIYRRSAIRFLDRLGKIVASSTLTPDVRSL